MLGVQGQFSSGEMEGFHCEAHQTNPRINSRATVPYVRSWRAPVGRIPGSGSRRNIMGTSEALTVDAGGVQLEHLRNMAGVPPEHWSTTGAALAAATCKHFLPGWSVDINGILR